MSRMAEAHIIGERLDELEQAYIIGSHSERQLLTHFAARWGVHKRTVRRYVRHIKARMLRMSQDAETPLSRQRRRELLRRKAERVFALAVQEGKFREGLVALETLVRIDQLHERTDAELAMQPKAKRPLAAVAPAELRERTRALLRAEGVSK